MVMARELTTDCELTGRFNARSTTKPAKIVCN